MLYWTTEHLKIIIMSPTVTLIFIFLLILFVPVTGLGQSRPDIPEIDTRYSPLQRDLNHLSDIISDLIIAPVQFQTSDVHHLILTVSMTSLLFSVDPAVDDFARRNQGKLNDHIFRIDKYFGGKETFFLTIGVYGTGWISGEQRLRRTGLMAFEAFIFSQAVTKLLKLTCGRVRPYGSRDPMHFKPFNGGDLFSSLPSGHTTGAFSFAIVMSHAYESALWKTFWYSSAALVGASRIYNKRHWLSDTFLSFAISYSIAEFVVHYEENQQDLKTSIPLFTVYPLFDNNVLGISLSVRI